MRVLFTLANQFRYVSKQQLLDVENPVIAASPGGDDDVDARILYDQLRRGFTSAAAAGWRENRRRSTARSVVASTLTSTRTCTLSRII